MSTGKMAEARRLVGASAANERREVAGLALRRAEAKLRRTADLSLRTSLDHQPSQENSRRPPDATSRLAYRAPLTFFGGGAHPTCESEPMLSGITFANKPLAESTSEACGVVTSEASGTCCFPSSSSVAEGGGDDSVHRVRMTGDQSRSGTKRDCPTSIADEQEGGAPAGGLQELREEIADLEGKILRRLGGDGGGAHKSGRKSSCEGRSGVGGEVEGWDATSAEAVGPAKRSIGGIGTATEKGGKVQMVEWDDHCPSREARFAAFKLLVFPQSRPNHVCPYSISLGILIISKTISVKTHHNSLE